MILNLDKNKIKSQIIALVFIGVLFLVSFGLAYNFPQIMAKYQLDKIIHFLAGGLIGLILFQYLPGYKFKLILLVVLVGGLWEFFEYYGVLQLDWPLTDLSRSNYILDTVLDEVAVGLGAMTFRFGLKKG